MQRLQRRHEPTNHIIQKDWGFGVYLVVYAALPCLELPKTGVLAYFGRENGAEHVVTVTPYLITG